MANYMRLIFQLYKLYAQIAVYAFNTGHSMQVDIGILLQFRDAKFCQCRQTSPTRDECNMIMMPKSYRASTDWLYRGSAQNYLDNYAVVNFTIIVQY